MTNPPSHSPAARSFQRRKHLGWGIALVALALLVVLADGPIAFGALAGLLGVVLLAVGVIGEQKANAYNRRDWALAESLAGQFEQLLSHDGGNAYGGAQGEYRVQTARLTFLAKSGVSPMTYRVTYRINRATNRKRRVEPKVLIPPLAGGKFTRKGTYFDCSVDVFAAVRLP